MLEIEGMSKGAISKYKKAISILKRLSELYPNDSELYKDYIKKYECRVTFLEEN